MTSTRHLPCLALACAALAALPADPASGASLPAGTTAILSGQPSLLAALPAPAGHSESSDRAVSESGDRVVFTSIADGLVDGDDDRVANVYVREISTGRVTL